MSFMMNTYGVRRLRTTQSRAKHPSHECSIPTDISPMAAMAGLVA
jgi:hypothetical protein